MSNTVKIYKHGEPKLTIMAEHLEEHKRLGWQECEAGDDEGDEFKYETATVKEMKKFLTACGIEFANEAKADELRELCRVECETEQDEV